jgi:COX assembly protein 1
MSDIGVGGVGVVSHAPTFVAGFDVSASASDPRAVTSTSIPRMSTLSRREEETLFKATKANALKECDHLVKGMFIFISTCLILELHSPCSICRVCIRTDRFSRLGVQTKVQRRSGLYISVVSLMVEKSTLVTHMLQSTRPESMQLVRDEYLRLRKEQQ